MLSLPSGLFGILSRNSNSLPVRQAGRYFSCSSHIFCCLTAGLKNSNSFFLFCLISLFLSHSSGRNPYPPSSIIKTLVLKNLFALSNLSDLVRFLYDFPILRQICSLDSFQSSPTVERFSHFLKSFPNSLLQTCRINLLHQIISHNQISGKFISADSCPVISPVKENNPKTNVKDRFNKYKICSADPDAKLGITVSFLKSKKSISYFWGYRNHILNDALSELPIDEITKPANIHDSQFLIPRLKFISSTFNFKTRAVIADSAYDSSPIFDFIVNDLHASPIIARNPRNSASTSSFSLSPKGIPVCLAGFEMISRGIFFDKSHNRKRHKFICPIKASKKFARKYPFCPWNHPKFFSNRFGCSTYIRLDIDDSIRKSINYGSQLFKKIYSHRTSSERIFSRLLSLSMQTPSVKGLNSISNVCTIAHITVLLIALAAVKSGNSDKIRFVKKLIPNL
ncbi:MAG: transposase [Elusimicrobia bacterium]|nr:transposase [Elusimicrobiota bacterium]